MRRSKLPEVPEPLSLAARKYLKRIILALLGKDFVEPETNELAPKEPLFCAYIGNNTLFATTVFGRKIYLDSEDLSLTPHIASSGLWEEWVSRFFLRELKPGDVFIDIGANCGFFSIFAANLVGPEGLVVAFEPQKKLATLAENSLLVNGFDSFSHVTTVAIGEEVGEATLGHVGKLRGSASLAPGFGDEAALSEQVRVRPLDLALAEISAKVGRSISPNMIKIDVEGYEFNVWKGMAKVLTECRDLTVLLEFSPLRYESLGQSPSDFIDSIIKEGFTISVLHEDSSERAISSNTVDEIMRSELCVDLVLRRRFN